MKRKVYILLTIVTLLVVFCYNLSVGESGSSAFTNGADNGNQSMYNPPFVTSPQSGGWQLQVMPSMGSRLVRDLYFTDSLTGYAVASPDSYTDSAHILKTTNGGNNWVIKGTYSGRLPRIIFINANIGFAGGNYLLKTTNAGENWVIWNWPLQRIIFDMQVFSEDTIWYADNYPTSGGAFRTTNGGVNWEKRDSGIPANNYPFYIYFYNSRIGFSTGGTNVYKTTNAGLNWIAAFTGGASKIYFRDSLNGYRTSQGFYRTTNGGFIWHKDSLPGVIGNTYTNKWVTNLNLSNQNTIYLVGGYVYFYGNGRSKAILYKTTNGGLNWGYQIPDTSYSIYNFLTVYSINNNVWCYDNYYNKGIYSSIGGDSTIYVGINNTSTEVPHNYKLFQNYPNPFNPITNVKFSILNAGNVKIVVFDVMGREVQTLVNERLNAGTYETTFDASQFATGIYFYQIIVSGESTHQTFTETRKMMLLK